ncbi:MAG: hypothetical protein V4850_03390 [Myxococcota bacterium]
MRTLLALLLVSGLLVSGAHAGTAVGNPTGFTLDTAPGAGLSFDSAVAEVESIVVTDRKGVIWTLPVDAPFDLLGGTRVEVPLADAAQVRVVFSGPLVYSGEGPEDTRFTLALTVPSVDLAIVAPPGELPDAVLRLGAPDWATATMLGLGAGRADVGAGDLLHDTLADALAGGAALYADEDGDGRCGDEEDTDDDDIDDDIDLDDDASGCDGTPLGTAVR